MKVLFACVHNAGRSQIAAAFFNRLADPLKARALSAGTSPARQVHPEVAAAMRESCPVVPGARHDDWPVEDPKGLSPERIRAIRNDIRDRVVAFIAAQHLGPSR